MFPEVEEKEIEQPSLVTVPGNRRGCARAGGGERNAHGADIDVYSFTAKAGEKLVFEVEARRAGSAIDPHLEVLDSGESAGVQ